MNSNDLEKLNNFTPDVHEKNYLNNFFMLEYIAKTYNYDKWSQTQKNKLSPTSKSSTSSTEKICSNDIISISQI
jgi:hypothetical protein